MMQRLWAAIGRGSWKREVFILGFLYAGYEWTRGMAPERKALAFSNAEAVQDVERGLNIDFESSANSLFLQHQWIADAASAFYQLAHEGVALLVLVWLWRRHRDKYPPLRATLVVMTLMSLATYWLVPLAPPRFAQSGIVDTLLVHPVLFAGMDSVTGLVNLYAAMPSVHVAWATWCALAVALASHRPQRHLVWLYPLTTAVVVLGTGNHYVLDVLVGAFYVGVGWFAVAYVHPDWIHVERAEIPG